MKIEITNKPEVDGKLRLEMHINDKWAGWFIVDLDEPESQFRRIQESAGRLIANHLLKRCPCDPGTAIPLTLESEI